MRREVFEYDSVTGTRKIFHELADGYAIETQTDVTDIIEMNKAQHAATGEREPFKGDFLDGQTLVARIPLSIYFELHRKGIIDPDGDCHDDSRLVRHLNDRDNIKLRTRPGRL
jgi:hypothetical protein